MALIDQEQAFDDLWDLWPKRKYPDKFKEEKALAKHAFCSWVRTDKALDLVKNRVAIAVADFEDGEELDLLRNVIRKGVVEWNGENEEKRRQHRALIARILKCRCDGGALDFEAPGIGCTPTELVAHVEKQFHGGMSWETWGVEEGKWGIDHILPLSNFDLTDPEDEAKAYHYTNLQPLWLKENVKKIVKENWTPPKKEPPKQEKQEKQPEKETEFDKIWLLWPDNEEYPESEDKARQAWDDVAMRRPEDRMVIAATHYIEKFMNPASGMKHSRHLSNFIRDDEAVDGALLAAEHVMAPSEIAEFEKHWAAYPDFRGKGNSQVKTDSMMYWRRHIESSDRFDFYIATVAYRKEQTANIEKTFQGDEEAEQSKFVKSMISFVGGWKWVEKYPSVLAQMLQGPMADAIRDLGMATPDFAGGGVRGALLHAAKFEDAVVDEEGHRTRKPVEDPDVLAVVTRVLKRVLSFNKSDIDPAPLAARIVQEAYQRACKRA